MIMVSVCGLCNVRSSQRPDKMESSQYLHSTVSTQYLVIYPALAVSTDQTRDTRPATGHRPAAAAWRHSGASSVSDVPPAPAAAAGSPALARTTNTSLHSPQSWLGLDSQARTCILPARSQEVSRRSASAGSLVSACCS